MTLVNLTTALSTGVVSMSSLAQVRVRDTEEQRQHRCDNARLDWERKWATTTALL